MTDVSVRVLPEGRTLAAAEGEPLRDVLIRAGLPVAFPCGGSGICGKCRVTVHEGGTTPDRTERETLAADELEAGIRLACRVKVKGSMSIALLEQVVEGLTVQPSDIKPKFTEPELGDIVFKGTFEEVNAYFYKREWSEGLPIVPPTMDKVQAFLAFTDRSPDEVIGSLLPDSREANIWNVAVNGVMAGCRPEYMPILMALVEVMADPGFGLHQSEGLFR